MDRAFFDRDARFPSRSREVDRERFLRANPFGVVLSGDDEGVAVDVDVDAIHRRGFLGGGGARTSSHVWFAPAREGV